MAAITSVNIDRILWCMRDRNITAAQLAEAIKIDKEQLDIILKGNGTFSLSQLKKLAKYFNRGLLFFISKTGVNETKLRTAGFRTLANEHPNLDLHIKSLLERVERQRQIFLNLREDLGEEVAHTSFPTVPLNDVKQAAAIVRDWLDIGNVRSFDSYRRAVEVKGILVFRSNGYIGSWRVPSESEIEGFSIYHKQFPIIFVRKQNAKQRELFTLAHELGHLILHGKGSIDNTANISSPTKEKEKEVNAFAGFLLVPDEVLSRINDREKPDSADKFDDWLKEHAKSCGVSVEVILRRLLQENRINKSEYERYRDWKKTQVYTEYGKAVRKYRYREPVNVFGRMFVGKVLEALGTKQLTVTKASRYLDNIKITDVHKLQREFNAL